MNLLRRRLAVLFLAPVLVIQPGISNSLNYPLPQNQESNSALFIEQAINLQSIFHLAESHFPRIRKGISAGFISAAHKGACLPVDLSVSGTQVRLVPLTTELFVVQGEGFYKLIDRMPSLESDLKISEAISQRVDDQTRFDPQLSYAAIDVVSGNPVGVVILALHRRDFRHVILTGLSILPQFEGTILSSWLFYRASLRAQEQGGEQLFWWTFQNPHPAKPGSERAIGFYEKAGASEIRRDLRLSGANIWEPVVMYGMLLSKYGLYWLHKEFQRKHEALMRGSS